ncbi:hypothetical protein, partial [Streptomyces europaeiscabiei]|uniref:hypothetical protein n=1 Tax=Streptomyces europaeiscabiei TaxID=146819 RepID=UPI000ADD1E14
MWLIAQFPAPLRGLRPFGAGPLARPRDCAHPCRWGGTGGRGGTLAAPVSASHPRPAPGADGVLTLGGESC